MKGLFCINGFIFMELLTALQASGVKRLLVSFNSPIPSQQQRNENTQENTKCVIHDGEVS